MKKTFTKLALCALTLLFATTASAGVKTTYNFVQAPSGQIVLPTWGEEILVRGKITMNMLAYGDNTFGNRFAIGPTSRNNESGGGFKFRTAGDWKGLYSQHADRNFSILDLKKGDKVTLTISKNDATLKFIDGDAVVSGQEYTVEADGTMDFVTTGSVYIESVTIEAKGLAVSIGIIPGGDPTVYDFVQAEEGSTVAPTFGADVTTGGNTLQLLSYSGNTFDNKFAVGPKNRNTGTDAGFIFRTAGAWKGLWSNWDNRNFSILNLKKGETVTLTISKNATTLSFVGGDAVVSGKAYTVEADGNLDFVTNAKGTYIENVSILPAGASGTSAGATVVTPVALDFTGSAIRAYIATEANAGKVTFKQVYKVPANTPLLLLADNTTPLETIVDELDGAAEDVSGNLLQGSATEAAELTSGETKYYVYGTHSKKAAFYYASAVTSQAGKAYLALTAAQAGNAPQLEFVFESNMTGIRNLTPALSKGDGAVYNLNGQRVSQPTKGLYIINGRKAIMK